MSPEKRERERARKGEMSLEKRGRGIAQGRDEPKKRGEGERKREMSLEKRGRESVRESARER